MGCFASGGDGRRRSTKPRFRVDRTGDDRRDFNAVIVIESNGGTRRVEIPRSGRAPQAPEAESLAAAERGQNSRSLARELCRRGWACESARATGGLRFVGAGAAADFSRSGTMRRVFGNRSRRSRDRLPALHLVAAGVLCGLVSAKRCVVRTATWHRPVEEDCRPCRRHPGFGAEDSGAASWGRGRLRSRQSVLCGPRQWFSPWRFDGYSLPSNAKDVRSAQRYRGASASAIVLCCF